MKHGRARRSAPGGTTPAFRGRRLLAALVAVIMLGIAVPSSGAQNADTFTIVAIPDTQRYVESDAGAAIFASEFQWIADNQQSRNIVFVSHVGDVAQNPSSGAEFDRIEEIFQILDDADVPYGISPGNHDINSDGTAPEYDARFGVDRYAGQPWFGGNHAAEGNRSSYQTVSIEGHDLLFLHLRHLISQYGPVEDVLSWADQVLSDHPDHLTFVTTHEFTAAAGYVIIPELQAVIESHCTVAVVFSGHRADGAGRGDFTDNCGRTVHHVLTNYQHFSDGGGGNIRTVEIDSASLAASFEVYSPLSDTYREDDAEDFTVSLSPIATTETVIGDPSCSGTVTIADAVMVAQYLVGVRTASQTCPLAGEALQLNVVAADVDGDGTVSIVDAVVIAQCIVGLESALCPG